ncbi:hypothetical protein BB558_006889 [Smittium angustum]|uniref:Uncharacterized protein n=1 Tax=Smittium angustum TaxID=133377 RepID=A0A2U1IWG3_SMIAN|nr:hypothetical protein BB558_006889 [Smittium angustum]
MHPFYNLSILENECSYPENNQNIPNPRPFFPETQNTNPLAMNLEHEAILDNNPEATNYVDSAPIPIPDSQ